MASSKFFLLSPAAWGTRSRAGAALLFFAMLCCTGTTAAPKTFDVSLTAAQSRQVDVQVTYPEAGCNPCRLVVFSHGAFAAPGRYARLLRAWAGAGFAIAAPLHVDSELHPAHARYPADEAKTVLARLEDFTLLVESQPLRDELLKRRVVLRDGVIAAGHSFGAVIAQAAAGARLVQADPAPVSLLAVRGRIVGAVALSPPGSAPGYFEQDDWALIERPMLVVTGTRDVIPGFFDDWRVHLDSFEAARASPAYAAIFHGQDHYFNGTYGRPKDLLSPATAAALARLTELTVTFMTSLGAGELPTAADWIARSGPGVEMLASTPKAER